MVNALRIAVNHLRHAALRYFIGCFTNASGMLRHGHYS
jgi:hypothetical protein